MDPAATPASLRDEADPATSASAVVLPFLRGRQAPFPGPSARLEIVGLGADDARPAATEALVRGLVFHARWIADTAIELAGPNSREASGRPPAMLEWSGLDVVALGAPTRNRVWMDRKVRLTGWRVRVAGTADAVVAGSALIAAERIGLKVQPLRAALISPGVTGGTDEERTGQQAYASFVALALLGRPG